VEKLAAADPQLHAFVIITDESRKPDLQKWIEELKLEKLGLVYLPVGVKGRVSSEYKLEKSKNVIVVSTKKRVTANFEDVAAKDFEKVIAAVKDLAK
jgi:hypothetical protein